MHHFDLQRARRVKAQVEAYQEALLEAQGLFFKETAKSQPDVGTGRPSAQAERRTEFAQTHGVHTDLSSDMNTVVLGFWGPEGTKIVCALGGHDIIQANLSPQVRRTLEKANAWR